MSTLAFYLRYAVRSLRRSGQRGALAVVCVAFGVFSLVGLQLLAETIDGAVLVEPRTALGGDLSLTRDGAPVLRADLETLAADPDVEIVDADAIVGARFVQSMSSSRIYIFNRILAVDPAAYPLVGEARLRDGAFAEALAQPASVVLSRDLVGPLGVDVGDRIRLAGAPGDTPTSLTIRGIAEALPDAGGGTILMSHATARTLNDGREQFSRIRLLTADPEAVAARAEAAGWTVSRPQAPNDDISKVFGFALPAAGLLGLLVGGIGVANTLQVLLSRRRTEVAVLKTLGYTQRDLLALFGIETALLGLLGGVLGVIGGIAGAEGLRQLTMDVLPFLLDLRIAPTVLLGGLAAGVLTAVLFGLIAIVRASAIRPATLLRQIPIRVTGRARAASVGLYVALFVLFGSLGSLLVGSWLSGFGVIAAGIVGLVVFGAVMTAVLLGVVRVPTPGLPLLGMATSNLRRRPLRAAASLVALFVGTFAIGISAQSIQNAVAQVDGRTVAPGQANLAAYGIEADTLAALAPDAAIWIDRSTAAEVSWADGTPIRSLRTLVGRGGEGQADLEVADTPDGERGRPWISAPDHALVPWSLGRIADREVAVGDTIRVRLGGAEAAFAIGGFYDRPDGIPVVQTSGVIVLPEAFAPLAGDADVTETVALEVPPDRLDAVAEAVATAHPEGVLIRGDDLVEMLTRLVRGLFVLVLALTSLALVAGTVLIANGVGLALVERRRELGVLKALGYSARQVLRTLVLENAVLGAIAGLLGVGAVAGTLLVLELASDVDIVVFPGILVALVAVAVLLAVGSALAVAWRPVRARPLDVLRSD
ncbi:MAG: FtsX-like permease family protein [Bacteroidota bacterium]